MHNNAPYQVDNGTVFDIEVYPGWVYVLFLDPDGTFHDFEFFTGMDNAVEIRCNLKEFLKKRLVCGFNSHGYDNHIIEALLGDKNLKYIYQLSYALFNETRYRQPATIDFDSIDLMGCVDRVSLKKLGVRMGWPTLQELPVDPSKAPTDEDKRVLRKYCRNDVLITAELYKIQADALRMREWLSNQYNVDLRSLTEPNIAENVIVGSYSAATGIRMKRLQNMTFSGDSVSIDPLGWFEQAGSVHGGIRAFINDACSGGIPLTDGKVNTSGLQRIIRIGDRSYQLGAGGVHSIDSPGMYQSTKDYNIVEYDVASYYPSIILQNDLWASHLKPEIISEIYQVIVSERLRAKASGDTLVANSLKIVINSFFGKSSSPHSALFDPRVMVSTTVIGQVGLLWLITVLADAGIHCLSANTDGIILKIPKDREVEVAGIVADWESHTGFTMERTDYSKYARKDVNNYICVKSDGKIKAKGRPFLSENCDLRHDPAGIIIATAVAAKIKNGTRIEHTINSCDTINPFIFSTSSIKGRISVADDALKNIRFYKSTKPSESLVTHYADGREVKVGNSENATVVLDLPLTMPQDIDRQFYITQARKLYKSVTRPLHVGQNIRAAELKGLGFTGLQPRDINKRNLPKHTVTRKYDNSFDFNVGQGFATKTGPAVDLIAIDLDYIERLPAELKHLLQKHPSKTCWCGDCEAADVRNGLHKGKIFFNTTDLKWWPRIPRKEILEKMGFEIFFSNSKPCMIQGYRDDKNSSYQLSDEIIEQLPDALAKWLLDTCYTKTSITNAKAVPFSDTVDADEDCTEKAISDENKKNLGNLIRSEEELKHLKFTSTVFGGAWVGTCTGNHRRPGNRDLAIYMKGDRVHAHCFHAGCDQPGMLAAQLNEINKAADTATYLVNPQLVEHLKPILNNIESSIADRLMSPLRHEVEVASTGTGKTYAIAVAVLRRVIMENTLTIVSCHSKIAIDSIVKEITTIGDMDDIAECNGIVIHSDAKKAELLSTTRIVILTHERMRRKGKSDEWYSIVSRLNEVREGKDLLVIIDECDAYLDGLQKTVTLDSRVLGVGKSVNKVDRCPAKITYDNCEKCGLLVDTAYGTTEGRYGIKEFHREYYPYCPGPADRNVPVGKIPIKSTPGGRYGTYNFDIVETHGKVYLESLDFTSHYGESEVSTPAEILQDMIDSAIAACITHNSPLFFGEPIRPCDMPGILAKEGGLGITLPSKPCDVRTLILLDGGPLELLNRLDCKLRFLTGTFMDVHSDMLKRVFGEVPVYETVGDSRLIDELLIVQMEKSFKNLSQIVTDHIESDGHIHLWFENKKVAAKDTYQKTTIKSKGFFEGVYHHKQKNDESDAQVLITYPRSSISRAANMPKYDVAVVDSECFDPRDAIVTLDRSKEVMVGRIAENIVTLIAQAAGRVLRRKRGDDGEIVRKVIVLHNLDKVPKVGTDESTPVNEVIKRIQTRVAAPIKVMKSDQTGTVMKLIDEFMTTGECSAEDAPVIETLNPIQKKCLKKITSMRSKSKGWTAARHASNVDRNFPNKQHRLILKKLFKTGQGLTKKNINSNISVDI